MIRVYLGGEGRDELGGWADHSSYRRADEPGVLETIIRHVLEGYPVEVVGAKQWKDIRKYRAGQHRSAELRNVLGLIEAARASGCDVLVFARDRDRDLGREGEIEAGLAKAGRTVPSRLSVASL